MGFKFGMEESVQDGSEVWDDKMKVEVTKDGRVRHIIGGIDDISKN